VCAENTEKREYRVRDGRETRRNTRHDESAERKRIMKKTDKIRGDVKIAKKDDHEEKPKNKRLYPKNARRCRQNTRRCGNRSESRSLRKANYEATSTKYEAMCKAKVRKLLKCAKN